MKGPVYRVYEAQVAGKEATFLVAMSDVREISLREEIARGERLLKLGRLVAETGNRNEAQEIANCEM